jgi:phage terminase small subunit
MTARMATPSPRALKRHDVTPTPVVRANKKRGASAVVDVAPTRKYKDTCATKAAAAEVDVNKPLTDKMRQFVHHWAKGDSIPSATLRAGYAGDGIGYQLCRMPNVLALYHAEKAKYEEASQMTRAKVMDMLMESYDMAKLMSEPSTMVAAAREVGKMCGYYAPVEHKLKVDVSGNIVVDRLNSMSDAELLKVITQGKAMVALPAP